MQRGNWITVLLGAASFWSVSGCGSAEDEDVTAAEGLSLSAGGMGTAGSGSAGFESGGSGSGGRGTCDPYLCQKFSRSNISGTPCSCPERGVACHGFLRNDQPLAPSTYFCRTN